MKTDLDQYLRRLRAVPLDVRLDQVEPLVWRRIGALRHVSSIGGVWGWRAALAGLMLSVGILADGAASAKPVHEVSPFAIHSMLAPSTLLEGGS